MKTKIYVAALLTSAAAYCNQTYAQANQDLSNLVAPTKVNVNLLP